MCRVERLCMGKSMTLPYIKLYNNHFFLSLCLSPPSDPPVCAWEGAKEVVAWVGERVELECLVKASPPSVTFAWKSVTFTPNMEQVSESNVRVREVVEECVCGR